MNKLLENRCRLLTKPGKLLLISILMLAASASAAERQFAGVVSSSTPEATAAGVEVLERGGNAIDAAVAMSLAVGVSEPAGSGIGGQTVMLIQSARGEAFAINGTTWSPAELPSEVEKQQLSHGHTAAAVPSSLRVLDLAHRRFGSGRLAWPDLLAPAIRIAEEGFVVGRFRHMAFSHYRDKLLLQPATAGIFMKPDGSTYQEGEVLKQPLLAKTLRRLSTAGAMDFYTGAIAAEIAEDMSGNGGWISAADLRDFPEPRIVPALSGSYRGLDFNTLPPPFGGWVVLLILNILEQSSQQDLATDDDQRRLLLLDAMRIAHNYRKQHPVSDYLDYGQAMQQRLSKSEAKQLVDAYRDESGGETTHFSVVDGDGMAVAVTQSIDSYFGAGVVNPQLGFLYNNYMQGFQVRDPDAPYALEARQMPKSSMSATIITENGKARLVLGSPGSARIISAVAQVSSHWVDISTGIESAVSAYRVHAVPDNKAYVEGESLSPQLMAGLAQRGFTLIRPAYGVSDSQFDPYFGGVHAVAFEQGAWTGTADPRRDGSVGYAWKEID